MSEPWRERGRVGLLTALMVLAAAWPARGNGDVQREVQGRVVSVGARAGTLVVDREFRGTTVRVALRVPPAARVFTCGEERASLDRVKAGMIVSVFYEVLGTEGVANFVVVEPGP